MKKGPNLDLREVFCVGCFSSTDYSLVEGSVLAKSEACYNVVSALPECCRLTSGFSSQLLIFITLDAKNLSNFPQRFICFLIFRTVTIIRNQFCKERSVSTSFLFR